MVDVLLPGSPDLEKEEVAELINELSVLWRKQRDGEGLLMKKVTSGHMVGTWTCHQPLAVILVVL